mmetsp:Transcript_5148/g.21154  ORF Transcript_5148/g.21154 Transcript_5148/m.21154 type:complete len:247 (+) Transcript_5148:2841-3581(+)
MASTLSWSRETDASSATSVACDWSATRNASDVVAAASRDDDDTGAATTWCCCGSTTRGVETTTSRAGAEDLAGVETIPPEMSCSFGGSCGAAGVSHAAVGATWSCACGSLTGAAAAGTSATATGAATGGGASAGFATRPPMGIAPPAAESPAMRSAIDRGRKEDFGASSGAAGGEETAGGGSILSRGSAACAADAGCGASSTIKRCCLTTFSSTSTSTQQPRASTPRFAPGAAPTSARATASSIDA